MMDGKRKVISPAKSSAAPTSESACLSGEKSARIQSAAVRHQARRMQSPNSIWRCLGFFENSQGDPSQCKSHHSSEVRHERSSGNLVSRAGADDDDVLAMDPETRDRMFPLIPQPTDSEAHRNSLSAAAARCSDQQPYAQSCGFDRVTVRFRENFSPASGVPLHEETNHLRSQDRHAMAHCARRSFPDRAN